MKKELPYWVCKSPYIEALRLSRPKLTPRGIIRKMYALLRDRRHWCQRCESCDAYGVPCDPESVRAVRWGQIGAMTKILSEYPEWTWVEKTQMTGEVFRLLLYHIRAEYPSAEYNDIIVFNDDRSHPDVLRVLRKAGWGKG